MKPAQRRLLGAAAEALAEGSELWRSVVDASADNFRDLMRARGELQGLVPAQLDETLCRMVRALKTLASDSDQMVDNFAGLAAQLAPYRRRVADR